MPQLTPLTAEQRINFEVFLESLRQDALDDDDLAAVYAAISPAYLDALEHGWDDPRKRGCYSENWPRPRRNLLPKGHCWHTKRTR